MKKFLASVAAVGLMSGAAFAQGVVLVPEDGSSDGRAFILVPVPQDEAASESAGARAGAATEPASPPNEMSRHVRSMALDFYQRGYRRGLADAVSRTGAQLQPDALEQIGRELFERGYMLGLMEAHARATAADMPEFDAQQKADGQQKAAAGGGQETAAADAGDLAGAAADGAADDAGQAAQQELALATEESPAAEGVAAQGPQAVIGSRDTEEYGVFLAGDDGRPVYMFTTDRQGQGEQVAASDCYGACAEAWPPVTSAVKPLAEDRANETLISGFEREDGSTQVTYNGWPLYYFAKDAGSEMPTGQDIEGFGGEWYLLEPDGGKVGHE